MKISGHRSVIYNRDERLTCYNCGKSLALEIILSARNGKKKCLTCAIMTLSITGKDISFLQESIKDGTLKNLVYFRNKIQGETKIRYTRNVNPETLEIKKEQVKTRNGKTTRRLLSDIALKITGD